MLRGGQLIQLLVIAMLGLAVVMVHSAGMRIDGEPVTLSGILTSRHAVYAYLAIGSMMLATRIDMRRVMRTSVTHHGPQGGKLGGKWGGMRGGVCGGVAGNPVFWVMVISLGLVGLTLIPGVATPVNGARRWLSVGGVSFQPSELVKWSMVPALAWWGARRGGMIRSFRHGLILPAMLVALSCGMIVIEDLGTAVLIGMVACCLLLVMGVRWWHLGMGLPFAAGAIYFFIMRSPYRLDRLTAFMDPWADPRGTGYHPIQSMLAIAQGGLTGRGLGNGIQKFGYLPEDTTDFIFAIICEELGLMGAFLVAGMLVALWWAGLRIAQRCGDAFGQLFALGVVLTIALQAVINIAVVTVVVPTKGIALPLLSAGGTGWILTATCLGLVAGMDRPLGDTIETGLIPCELDDDGDELSDEVALA